MLGFLFGRKHPPEPQTPRAHPPHPAHPHAPGHADLEAQAAGMAHGTHIAYHPDLITELKDDHVALLLLFRDIATRHAAGHLEETADLMEQFRLALSGHLLKENVKFYIYLEHALAEDPASHALMHQFRHEMDGIGKAVLDFLDRHRHIATRPEASAHFSEELAAIGKVLVARIRNEENTLYSLYMPAG